MRTRDGKAKGFRIGQEKSRVTGKGDGSMKRKAR
jgi:hypothetical protein